ncbi:unnamed protein product [Aphanomyces euteiches]
MQLGFLAALIAVAAADGTTCSSTELECKAPNGTVASCISNPNHQGCCYGVPYFFHVGASSSLPAQYCCKDDAGNPLITQTPCETTPAPSTTPLGLTCPTSQIECKDRSGVVTACIINPNHMGCCYGTAYFLYVGASLSGAPQYCCLDSQGNTLITTTQCSNDTNSTTVSPSTTTSSPSSTASPSTVSPSSTSTAQPSSKTPTSQPSSTSTGTSTAGPTSNPAPTTGAGSTVSPVANTTSAPDSTPATSEGQDASPSSTISAKVTPAPTTTPKSSATFAWLSLAASFVALALTINL